MREIADAAVSDAKIDRHGRTAEPRMRPGGRIGRGEAAETRYVGGQFQDTFVIDIIQHGAAFFVAGGTGGRPYISFRASDVEGLQVRGAASLVMPFEEAAMDDVVKIKPFRTEPVQKPTQEEAEAAVRTLIAWAGDDPEREGLIDTPRRVAKAYQEFYAGYGENPNEELARVFAEVEGYADMVLVRDISFFSHCEHHMAPFSGKAHVGYFPRDGVVGISKLARIVDTFARRLQTQEALTAQIANAIEEGLRSRGVAVMIEAEHSCMTMRGVKKQGASTVTTQFTGVFRDPNERLRFLTMVNGAK